MILSIPASRQTQRALFVIAASISVSFTVTVINHLRVPIMRATEQVEAPRIAVTKASLALASFAV